MYWRDSEGLANFAECIASAREDGTLSVCLPVKIAISEEYWHDELLKQIWVSQIMMFVAQIGGIDEIILLTGGLENEADRFYFKDPTGPVLEDFYKRLILLVSIHLPL